MSRELASIAFMVLALTSARADFVSYREIFAHSGTDAPNFSNGLPTNGGTAAHINWQLRGANMVGQITNLSTGAAVNTVAAGTGISTNLNAVNSGPQQGVQTTNGFAVIPSGTVSPIANNAPFILYTSEHTQSLSSITRFSWYQGNHSTSDAWRVAIEVDGGQWFASDSSFTNASITSGSGFATNGEFKELAMGSASWRTLDFDGSLAANSRSLALGAAATPTGVNVTRFGMYSENKTNNLRFDTFQIESVPEPATLATIGVALLAFRRNRRTSKA